MWTRLLAALEDGIARGDHFGAQACVYQHGRRIADLAVGRRDATTALRPDHLLPWMSASKPLTAVAIAQLWERGALDLEDTVAQHVPAFAAHGKDRLTIRHLLTHTGGFRVADIGTPATPWAETIDRITQTRLEPRWVPGQMAGYHVHTSWFMLGEIVQRLDGRRLDHYLRAAVCEPAGLLDTWLGMPAAEHATYGERVAPTWDTRTATPESRGVETAAHCAWIVPGGAGYGPARELARFYELLRNGGALDGRRVLLPQTVAALTARHRVGLRDRTFGHIVDWGLGFLCDSQHYGDPAVPYGFGPHASSRTFGHGGRESSVGFCDPERALAGALIWNGMPGEPRHDARLRAAMAALYDDLADLPA